MKKNKKPPNILGHAIREQRKKAKITQQELSDLARTGLNFVSQLERGKETVRLDKVLAMLSILGLELRLSRGKRVIVIDEGL